MPQIVPTVGSASCVRSCTHHEGNLILFSVATLVEINVIGLSDDIFGIF